MNEHPHNQAIERAAHGTVDVQSLGGLALQEQPPAAELEMRIPNYFASDTLKVYARQEILAAANELYAEATADPIVRMVEEQFEAKLDYYTLEHMQRTTQLGLLVGLELGIDTARLRLFARAMRVHDQGKLNPHIQQLIYAPREWQQDAGPRGIVNGHAVEGMENLAGTGLSTIELGIIGGHHLRKARNGYGVTEERLPMAQRDEELEELATIADVGDALWSARPYHETIRPRAEATAVVLAEANVRQTMKDTYLGLVQRTADPSLVLAASATAL